MRAGQRWLVRGAYSLMSMAGTAPLVSPFAVPAPVKAMISVHTHPGDSISSQETSAHPYIKCSPSLWCSGPAVKSTHVSPKACEVKNFWLETFPSNASRCAVHCQLKQF